MSAEMLRSKHVLAGFFTSLTVNLTHPEAAGRHLTELNSDALRCNSYHKREADVIFQIYYYVKKMG